MEARVYKVSLNGKGRIGTMGETELKEYCKDNGLQAMEISRNYGVCDCWYGIDVERWIEKHGSSVDVVSLVPRGYEKYSVWNS